VNTVIATDFDNTSLHGLLSITLKTSPEKTVHD